ncbi:hypothetical protein BGZ54_004491, partial [Gamsiella multidivaricata]
KEVEAMRLRNALETARLQDQVARHVQVNNLIERNKLREEKELERQMRRRQRKLERKEEKRAQAAGGESMDMADEPSGGVGGVSDEHVKRSEKRHHHRHHPRHRSPRVDEDGETKEEDGAEKTSDEVDEETARRIRKMERQERRERRERKEKRAQRRLEKEAEARENEERIQLPFVVVRVPGYAGQSSDSEASISVVRRVREDTRSRKSSKSKRHGSSTGDETTMVEIKIPHQEELSIISDTEILGDLGLNEVPLNELKTMLPPNALQNARYTTNTKVVPGMGEELMATVCGGFERALVCSAG